MARWFASNGWAYPVPGPPAPGVAAVQQFFECMGLSKPPPLQLSETAFSYQLIPPETQSGQFTLRTSAKKWVYGMADSDKPWLRITTPVAAGPQQAQFTFEIDSRLMEKNQVHEGTVQLIANAGQKLSVRVVVAVRQPQESFTRRLLRPFQPDGRLQPEPLTQRAQHSYDVDMRLPNDSWARQATAAVFRYDLGVPALPCGNGTAGGPAGSPARRTSRSGGAAPTFSLDDRRY